MANLIKEHAEKYITDSLAEQITKQAIWSRELGKEAAQPGLGPTLQKCMTTGREIAETNAISEARLSDPDRWPGCVKVHTYNIQREVLHVVAPRDDEDSRYFFDKPFDKEMCNIKTRAVPLFFTRHEPNGFFTGSNAAQYEKIVEIEKFADESMRNRAYLNSLRRHTAESIESRLRELEAEEKGEGEEGKGGTL